MMTSIIFTRAYKYYLKNVCYIEKKAHMCVGKNEKLNLSLNLYIHI